MDSEGTTLIKNEESATGRVGFGVYSRYLKSIGLLYATVTILTSLINQIFQIYGSIWLGMWAAHSEPNAPHVRDLFLGIYGVFGVAQGTFVF